MPSYKKSPGDIQINTPHESFTQWLREELENMRAWNPSYVTHPVGNVWEFHGAKGFLWRIRLTKTGVSVRSDEPVIWLRHGVRILMGQGRLEVA